MENKSNNHYKLVPIVIMSVSLTFAIVTGGFAVSLSSRVRANEEAVNKIDVILEKIDNIEKNVEKIETRMREKDND